MMPYFETNKVRTRFVNISLAAAAVVLFFAILEIALALFYPQKVTARPFFHIQSFFCQYHPVLGWVNKPNYRGEVRVDDNYRFFVTHNGRGLRGREHPYARTPGKRRVLVLGDSFAWGFGVGDRQIFGSLMEEKRHDLEVVNMGVSGYGTDQELLSYLDEGIKYRPDLVIVLFYANDLGEVASSINYGYPKPVFDPDASPPTFYNVPVPTTSESERMLYGNPPTAWGKLKRFLRRNTHTYPFVMNRLNSIPSLRALFLKTGLAEPYSAGVATGNFYQLEGEGKRWHLLGRLFEELRIKTRTNGSEFLLVNVPMREKYSSGKKEREAVLKQNNLFAEKLATFMPPSHFIDLLPLVRKGEASGARYYSNHERDIHFNAEGHRMLAEAVLAWMREHGWSEERAPHE